MAGLPLPQGQTLSLLCLRSLQVLELDNVPIMQVKGLRNLRPSLRSFTARNVCKKLSELLLQCGGDMVSKFFLFWFIAYIYFELKFLYKSVFLRFEIFSMVNFMPWYF